MNLFHLVKLNKTILNLNYKISLIIVSVLGMVFAFLSNAFYVEGLMGYILYVLRLILFSSVYFIMFLLEKNNKEFKNAAKRMLGYVGVSSLFNMTFAIFSTTHLLKGVFLNIVLANHFFIPLLLYSNFSILTISS